MVIKDNHYYLLIEDNISKLHYLIDVEKGIVIEQGNESLDLFLKDAVEVDEYNMKHQYIFITPTYSANYSSYCHNIVNCNYITDYDIGYHFLVTKPRGLIMQDTTYDVSDEMSEKTLKIGFFSFSNSKNLPDYSAAKSIVVNNPSLISYFGQPSKASGRNLEQNIVPADILSRIEKMWKIDSKGRYLVGFGQSHPFLFVILDINRGLDIPENHLKNVYFVDYQIMLKKFGQFNNPILRANSLSQWLSDVTVENR